MPPTADRALPKRDSDNRRPCCITREREKVIQHGHGGRKRPRIARAPCCITSRRRARRQGRGLKCHASFRPPRAPRASLPKVPIPSGGCQERRAPGALPSRTYWSVREGRLAGRFQAQNVALAEAKVHIATAARAPSRHTCSNERGRELSKYGWKGRKAARIAKAPYLLNWQEEGIEQVWAERPPSRPDRPGAILAHLAAAAEPRP